MSYEHPIPPTDLRNLHHAMDYNAAGQPVLRTISTAGISSSDGQFDAFGRQRIAQPYTLFDSTLRYSTRSEQWATSITGSASTQYNINQSTNTLIVTSASGDKVTRETKRVFPYQPGKSLQVLASFVMDQGQTGLAQRVGYFNDQNGVFFSNKNGTNYIVKRSYISGTAVDLEIPQSEWNIDTLDGTTTSGINLDETKAQILFLDFEWLGVGQVRAGFVINGNFFLAHVFRHSNLIDTVYMTTATLPVRYEIENIGATVAGSELKQICTTVISEGGYEIKGRKHSAGRPTTSPKDLTNAGTFYPVVSIQLNPSYLDAIALIKNISMLGIANNGIFQYKLIANATISGGTWTSDTGSLVQYNITANTMTGGETLTSGYAGINNQSAQAITLDSGAFSFQLERDGLTSTPVTYTLAVASATSGDDVIGSMDWEELF